MLISGWDGGEASPHCIKETVCGMMPLKAGPSSVRQFCLFSRTQCQKIWPIAFDKIPHQTPQTLLVQEHVISPLMKDVVKASYVSHLF